MRNRKRKRKEKLFLALLKTVSSNWQLTERNLFNISKFQVRVSREWQCQSLCCRKWVTSIFVFCLFPLSKQRIFVSCWNSQKNRDLATRDKLTKQERFRPNTLSHVCVCVCADVCGIGIKRREREREEKNGDYMVINQKKKKEQNEALKYIVEKHR